MRHVPFALLIALHVVVIAQNWGIYNAALLVAVYRFCDGLGYRVP